MSKLDENEIRRRLECISRIEPTAEATERAVARARRTLEAESDLSQAARKSLLSLIFKSPAARFAAAAALLIAAGYLAGRLSTPGPSDIEQLEAALETRLRSSLEPAIRRDLLEEVTRSWQSALAKYHAGLNEQFNAFAAGLSEQHSRDLNEFAIKTLAASNAVTHQLLNDLVRTIATAQQQDRRWVSAALQHIELNRIGDAARLGTGLVSLAEQTHGEFTRTNKDLARILSVVSRDEMPPGKEQN